MESARNLRCSSVTLGVLRDAPTGGGGSHHDVGVGYVRSGTAILVVNNALARLTSSSFL
jgi:hypothetical protein